MVSHPVDIDPVNSGYKLYYDSRHDSFRSYDLSTKRFIRISRSLNEVSRRLYTRQERRNEVRRVIREEAPGADSVLRILGEGFSKLPKTSLKSTQYS